MMEFNKSAIGMETALQRQVIYHNQEALNTLNRSWQACSSHYLDEINKKSKKPSNAPFNCSMEMMSVISSMKHFSWKHEREIRYLFPVFTPDFTEGQFEVLEFIKKGAGISGVEYRLRNNLIIPYIPVPYGKKIEVNKFNFNEAVCEVVLGPQNENHPSTVSAFLKNNGFSNFDISTSSCQFK